MSHAELAEAAKIVEALTGASPTGKLRKMGKKERQDQAARVRRFLVLPPALQEGALQYAEKMRQSYRRQ